MANKEESGIDVLNKECEMVSAEVALMVFKIMLEVLPYDPRVYMLYFLNSLT